MKSRAFTLIELLAVIVILAIIALISTPLVLNVIGNAKKGAFKASSINIVDSAFNGYMLTQLSEGAPSYTEYEYINGLETKTGNVNVDYKGSKPKNGKLVITSSGKVAVAFYQDGYCAKKGYHDDELKMEKMIQDECVVDSLVFEKSISFGGSGDEDFKDINVVDDGYVVVGFSSSDDYDLEGLNKGENDAIILKYNHNGDIVWQKKIGGSDNDVYEGIAVTNNDYIAVGYSYSNDYDLAGLNHGWYDALIYIYNENS